MAVRSAGPASDNRELLEAAGGFLIVDGTGKFDLLLAVGSCIDCMTERRLESIVVHKSVDQHKSDTENASRNENRHVYVTNVCVLGPSPSFARRATDIAVPLNDYPDHQ